MRVGFKRGTHQTAWIAVQQLHTGASCWWWEGP